MRPLSASECITPAIERTKSLLFRPFQWRTFLKLTAVAFFAEISGGGSSFSSPARHGHLPGGFPVPQGMIVALLVFIVFVVLLISLVLLYIGSRLQLVLVEVVATRQTTLAPIWRRNSRLTWRWIGLKLLFFLVFGLAFLALLSPILITMIRHMPSGGEAPSAAFFSHIFLSIAAILVGLTLMVAAYVLLRDFALPFLAIEDLPITAALSRLRNLVAAAPGEVALYLLLRFVLGLVAAIGAEIVIVIVLLVSLIPLALIGVVLWLALHHAGTIGTAALIGSAAVGGLILFLWMAGVIIGLLGTIFVFTQSFALYFLGGRYPRLGNILEPLPYPMPPPPLSMPGPPLPVDPSPA